MKWFLLLSILLLQACSNLPDNIKNAPSVDIQPQQALSNSNDFTNYPVRWGGKIINVENKADETKIQILAYPLNYYGRPQLNQSPSGRFLSVSKQFLDPAIYTKDSEITIAGSLQGTLEKTIGEKTITVPIVTIDYHHIWPRQQQQNYYREYNYNPYYGYRGYYPYNSYRGGYRYYNCY